MSSPTLPAHRLDPMVRTVWYVAAAGVILMTVGAAVGVVVAEVIPAAAAGPLALVIAAMVALVPGLRYQRWRYEIRSSDVFLSYGVVIHTIALVPFDRIQLVETSQGPVDRRIGLMNLTIRTAGGSEQIPGLTIAEAERLREELARVTGSTTV